MRLLEKLSRFEGFEMDWRRLIIQGFFIMLAGISMALASIVNPEGVILSAMGFSWLPVSGMILIILGLLECLDAFLAKEQRDVIQNMQVGVLDIVIGILIVGSISGIVSRITMMIAAFLIVRGIIRIFFVYALKLPHKLTTLIAGGIAIIMGILLSQEWPTAEGWFVSLCLNIEIAFRGWAVISFALWVRQQKKAAKSS